MATLLDVVDSYSFYPSLSIDEQCGLLAKWLKINKKSVMNVLCGDTAQNIHHNLYFQVYEFREITTKNSGQKCVQKETSTGS